MGDRQKATTAEDVKTQYDQLSEAEKARFAEAMKQKPEFQAAPRRPGHYVPLERAR